MRHVLILVTAAAIAAAVAAIGDGDQQNTTLRIHVGARTVTIPLSRYQRAGAVKPVLLRRVIDTAIPSGGAVRRGTATITVRYDRAAVIRRASLLNGGGVVRTPARPIGVEIRAPVIRQAQRNTCESAALEILTAAAGRRIDQDRLQAAFPVSGPPDPAGAGPDRMWGDPDEGYVGRADGGGTDGGFGVYPPPVIATAARFGVTLDDLSGASPASIYSRLLSGRAVMAWVGLSDGPFASWLSPSGRRIDVNFGEHTIVLDGIRPDGQLLVSNPLEGTRELWSKSRFEAGWELLGRRAVSPS